MTGPGSWTIGAALRVQHELRPKDEATSRRLVELVTGEPRRHQPKITPVVEVSPPPDPLPPVIVAPSELEDTSTRQPLLRLGERLGMLAGPLVGAVAALISTLADRWGRDRLLTAELSTQTWQLPTADARQVLDAPRAGIDPVVAPLFLPRWTTGIITTALAMEKPTGPVDTARLVEQLARMNVPAHFPRLRRRSVTSGAQVLVDLSEDMLPFREDLIHLLRSLRRALGDDRVNVLRFAGRPMTQIGPGRRDTWHAYEPPPRPRPVLIVSNLRQSDAQFSTEDDFHGEFTTLLDGLDRIRCPVLALVPNSATRMRHRVRRTVPVLEWDRTTSAAVAARATRQ
jgi:hypothetical protein